MKIAVIIPTRGDRPHLLKQCHKLIARQTHQPDEIIVIDYAPNGGMKDITQRYRKGVEEATKRGCTCAFFWEDDDWYHPTYIAWVLKEWVGHKQPQVFGISETYYYHIGANARLYMGHAGRTSAFCTIVKLPYKGTWPSDYYPFLDMHFHKQGIVKSVKFPKDKILAIGIKHGVGLTGGGGHNARFKWDMIGKEARGWFVKHMDEELKFYDEMAKKLPHTQAQKIPHRKHRGFITPAIKKVNKNGRKVIQKKVTSVNSRTQLHRRGRKIIKIRGK